MQQTVCAILALKIPAIAAALQALSNTTAHSAKLTALLARLREADAASADDTRPIKSVIFSQFATMLDAVGAALAAEGVRYVRIDGSMTAGKRAAAIAAFSETAADTPRVALVSLKAGGVGLNLTVASQVCIKPPVCGTQPGLLNQHAANNPRYI